MDERRDDMEAATKLSAEFCAVGQKLIGWKRCFGLDVSDEQFESVVETCREVERAVFGRERKGVAGAVDVGDALVESGHEMCSGVCEGEVVRTKQHKHTSNCYSVVHSGGDRVRELVCGYEWQES
jgi:hypothetical protein